MYFPNILDQLQPLLVQWIPVEKDCDRHASYALETKVTYRTLHNATTRAGRGTYGPAKMTVRINCHIVAIDKFSTHH